MKNFKDYNEFATYTMAENLKAAVDGNNIKVLTIAMSPECCDGWVNSFNITKQILSILSEEGKKEFISMLQKKINI